MKKYHDKKVTTEQLFWARFIASGLSRQQAAQLLGVNRTTFRRWETGQSRIPKAAYLLLMFAAGGYVSPVAGAAWQGWFFKDGELYAPNGWHFTPGELMNLPLLYTLSHKPLRNAKSAP